MTSAAAMAVFAGLLATIVAMTRKDKRQVRDLRAVLEATYLDDRSPLSSEETSSLLARTGVAAEEAFKGVSFLGRVRDKIDRSDWTVSAGEFVVISVVC
jgi:hypothetical protein